jgi:hypothetical protein
MENVKIDIFLELNEMFDKSELTSKILRLVKPSKMIVSFNDSELYNKTFNRELIITDWGVWGLFRNKPID